MEISSVPATTTAMAVASQQLQATMEAQVAMLQELAEMQQQVAQLLADGGIGQNISLTV